MAAIKITVEDLIKGLNELTDHGALVDVYNGSVVGVYVEDDGSVFIENS